MDYLYLKAGLLNNIEKMKNSPKFNDIIQNIPDISTNKLSMESFVNELDTEISKLK